MKSAVAKKEIESTLASRFGAIFERREKRAAETVSTGVPEVDELLNGFPRGAITEIYGAPSSGRTTVLLSALAAATSQDETCALIDCNDTFDLSSATKAGMDFDLLLWVRCDNNLERAFKATDLVLQSGGFGLVTLNLADVSSKNARRIISTWWFRFRRALENTLTALVVITPVACIRSCAALVLELSNEETVWPGTVSFISENSDAKVTAIKSRPLHLSVAADAATEGRGSRVSLTHANLLEGLRVQVNRERPITWMSRTTRFESLSSCAR